MALGDEEERIRSGGRWKGQDEIEREAWLAAGGSVPSPPLPSWTENLTRNAFIAVGIFFAACAGYFFYAEIYMSADWQWARHTAQTQRNLEEVNAKIASARKELAASGVDADFTMEKYDRIAVGASYETVAAIMQMPGQESARSDVAGILTVSYTWQSPIGPNMIAMFQNGRLITKAQHGFVRLH